MVQTALSSLICKLQKKSPAWQACKQAAWQWLILFILGTTVMYGILPVHELWTSQPVSLSCEPDDCVLINENLLTDSGISGRLTAIHINSDLLNNWAHFTIILKDPQTDQLQSRQLELSYYRDMNGTDAAAEGSVYFTTQPNHTYALCVVPQIALPQATGPQKVLSRLGSIPAHYTCHAFNGAQTMKRWFLFLASFWALWPLYLAIKAYFSE